MANIKDIRKRIKSITNTQKVTHAMELIAATKMRRSQQAALSARPYSLSLSQILGKLNFKTEFANPLLVSNDSPTQVIILITSDRGLAGGLNINLFREILRDLPAGRQADIKNFQYITVGKKGTNFAVKTKGEIIASFQSEEKEPLDLARTLTKLAIETFSEGKTSKVTLVYPHFESPIKQIPTWIQLLPIEFHQLAELQKDKPEGPTSRQSDILLFEPSAREVLSAILPHYVLVRIYQVLLEAKASEHSARMIAMKNATDAAGDLIDDLTLTYNQARQETITKELLDIITAQKALE